MDKASTTTWACEREPEYTNEILGFIEDEPGIYYFVMNDGEVLRNSNIIREHVSDETIFIASDRVNYRLERLFKEGRVATIYREGKQCIAGIDFTYWTTYATPVFTHASAITRNGSDITMYEYEFKIDKDHILYDSHVMMQIERRIKPDGLFEDTIIEMRPYTTEKIHDT